MKKPPTIEEGRRANRFTLRAHATLVAGDGNWTAHLLNLSAKGALIAITEDHSIEPDNEVTLAVELGENDHLIMHGKVIHVKDHYVGLECSTHGDQDENRLSKLVKKYEEGSATDDYL